LGNDVVLNWDAVNEDVEGNTINVTDYKIYSSGSASASLEDYNYNGQISTTTFTHENAATTSKIFYKVTAVYGENVTLRTDCLNEIEKLLNKNEGDNL